eukprot:COSAG04_NODE_2516_length_3983_cov_1.947219_1_plen_32_part_10
MPLIVRVAVALTLFGGLAAAVAAMRGRHLARS